MKSTNSTPLSITKQRSKTKTMVLTGTMAALLAIMSQISIPLPSGVPVTMQTFAVALAGFVLGPACGTAAVAIFLLGGFIGLPVFAGFTGGPGSFVSLTGGFLYGFVPMAFLCGLSTHLLRSTGKGTKNSRLPSQAHGSPMALVKPRTSQLASLLSCLPISLLGLALCHLAGIVQFSLLSGNSFSASFLLVSLPYMVKDIASIAGAFLVSLPIRLALRHAG